MNEGFRLPIKNTKPLENGAVSTQKVENDQGNDKNSLSLKIPLTEDDYNLSNKAFAEKFKISRKSIRYLKKLGYKSISNPYYVKNAQTLQRELRFQGKNMLKELLPHTEHEFLAGNYNIKIDDLKEGGKFIKWKEKHQVDNLEVTNAELYILKKLQELNSRRNKEGGLEIFDKNTNTYVPFIGATFSKMIGGNVAAIDQTKNGEKVQFSLINNGVEFTKRFLPNLLAQGVLKESDFNVSANSKFQEIYATKERILKKGLNEILLSGNAGPVKYYLGRDKIVGTKTKINPGTMSVIQLDNNTFAITDSYFFGKKKIIYTFEGVTKQEREDLKAKLYERRPDIKIKDEGEISPHLRAEMNGRIKSYDLKSIFSRKKDESEVDFEKRLSQFSDVNLVTTTVRNFTSKRSVPILKLSWKEQLQIAAMISTFTKDKEDRVGNFLENYSAEGLRTFISMSEDKKMGDKILSLGEKLSKVKSIADKIFSKYGEIIDSAEQAEKEVKRLYERENIPNKVFDSIKDILLKRGTELLSGLSDSINTDNQIEEQGIMETLEDIKTSTIIMGASYIELYKQNIEVPIGDIENTTLEKISAENLTAEEKKELLKVYEKGRPKETYENEEHIKLLTEEFEATLNNKDTFVFNIRFNGEIIAFATFYKVNEDTLHIGGLTFIEDVRNPAIGYAVMNSIMNEFGNFNIQALVHSENEVRKMYQKRFGFKIIKELPREENAGELYYEIERPRNINEVKVIGETQEFNKAA